MKKLLVLIVICVCGPMLAACGDVKGTPVEHANACAAENDKKAIAVSGFLSDGGEDGKFGSLFCSNIGGGPVKCGFKLLAAAGASGKGFSADIIQGTYANNVEKMERGYKMEDLKVRDNAGKIIDLAKQVKLTGTINVAKNASTPENDVCYLTVAKIEQ